MKSIISVKNLVKQYDKSKKPSVNDVSFEVNEGEFFAFLGPNGAGKTTTISILTTTLSKTSGTVKIYGYDVEKESKKVREKVGIIFQKPSLDEHLSAEENIRFHACLYGMFGYRPTFKMMPLEYKKHIMNLSEIVGIQDSLFKPIKKLSGGMKRKLEIMRSLIHTPKVLFLDEPTQGLDPVSRRNLWEYLNNVRKEYGTTVFLTTHYIDEAEHVDKVCIINQGKIAMSKTPDEMKKNILKKEIIIDSENREELINELSVMSIPYKIENQIIVPYKDDTAQEIISKIKTKLTTLKIQEPSLEDAYIEYLSKNGGTNL